MEVGGNRNNCKDRNEASKRTSQGSLPSGSHGLCPQLYRHQGELLRTSQTKRKNRAFLRLAEANKSQESNTFPWTPPGLSTGEGLGQQQEEGGQGVLQRPTCERVPSGTHSGPGATLLLLCSHNPGLHALLDSANTDMIADSLSHQTPVKAYLEPQHVSGLAGLGGG